MLQRPDSFVHRETLLKFAVADHFRLQSDRNDIPFIFKCHYILQVCFHRKVYHYNQNGLQLQKNNCDFFYNMMNICLFNDKHHFVKGSIEILSFELAAIDNLNIFNQTIVWYFFSLTDWRYGAVLCKLTPFLQGISVCASVNTLAAIAIDRY